MFGEYAPHKFTEYQPLVGAVSQMIMSIDCFYFRVCCCLNNDHRLVLRGLADVRDA